MMAKLVEAGLKEGFHFKAELIFSLFEKVVRLALLYYFFRAVLGAGEELATTITYLIAAVLVEGIVSGGVLDLMARKVATGEACYWTVRPRPFVAVLLGYSFGRKLPTMAMCLLLLLVLGPARNLPLFLLSLALAYGIAYGIEFVLGLCVLVTINAWGIKLLHRALFLVLSGVMFPVGLLPAGARSLLYALPFHGVVGTPVQVLLGKNAPWMVPTQAAWLAALILAATAIARRTRATAVTVGG